MDIREYISSGILELYACNTLSDEERKEVEAMVLQYPEVAAELHLIEQSLEGLAHTMAATPGPRVRSAILDAISEETSDDEPAEGYTESAGEAKAGDGFRPAANLAIYKWMLAASVVLLLISSYLAASFYAKWQSSSDRVLALQQQQNLLAERNKVLSTNYESSLAMLRNPSTRIVPLAGTEKYPESKVMVYWDENSGKVILDQLSLPGHDEKHQYQLWAIKDGKPVDAGVFDAAEGALIPLKTILEADAFAITLEPRGGSSSPTMEQMVVIGKI